MDIYTELKITGLVECADVKSIIATNYEYHLQHFGCGNYGVSKPKRGLLEIGFVEENPIILTNTEGEEITVTENGIYIIPPESDYKLRAVNEGLHRHTAAIFIIGCRNRKRVAFYSPPDGTYVTLPLVIPPTPGSSEIFTAIRTIMSKHPNQSELNHFESCADFMGLIHKINKLMMDAKGIDNASPGNRRYCDRAKQYIAQNIEKKISVGEIATAAGVSKNYLTNIFSQSEGMPLIEYINRRKLTHMLALIDSENYSLSQAGEQVGISDPNYISRIFKRYYGMTFSEYKRNKKDLL